MLHAATVGAIAGVTSWLEAPHTPDSGLRALLVGAAVAGLSGGAGAAIRAKQSPLGAEDIGEVLSRLAKVEGAVLELRSMVAVVLGERELSQRKGKQ